MRAGKEYRVIPTGSLAARTTSSRPAPSTSSPTKSTSHPSPSPSPSIHPAVQSFSRRAALPSSSAALLVLHCRQVEIHPSKLVFDIGSQLNPHATRERQGDGCGCDRAGDVGCGYGTAEEVGGGGLGAGEDGAAGVSGPGPGATPGARGLQGHAAQH